MANFTTTTTINTGGSKGSLTATKSGSYNEVINLTQVVDNSASFVDIASGGSSKGTATLSDCKSLIIKNSGVSGAEVQLKTYLVGNGTPDTTGAASYDTFLLGAGDYIYLPNMRKFSFDNDSSGGNAYAIDDAAPSTNQYAPVDNCADGDPQLLNEALDNSETGIDVDEGEYFFVGDLIRVEDEIMEVTGISSNTLTVIRGTHGSDKATHAEDTAIRYPFFNAYENFTAATGGYDVLQTNANGLLKVTNMFGIGRNTDGSGNRQSNGVVAGSFSGHFCSLGGYQELGLSGITSSTTTGLTASTAYEFDIQVDGGTNFDNLTFTTDSSDLSFGKTIRLIQDALDTQFYTSGNLFEKKVNVGIVNGDVRFSSASNLDTSAIVLTAGSTGAAEFLGTGRIPAVAKLAHPVASYFTPLTVLNKKSGIEEPNIAGMFYDDGHGNILGTATGTINYETGALDIKGLPNAHIKISVNYGSGHSGGNKFSSDAANSIYKIAGRSTNSKLNTTIEIIGLN